MSAAVCSHLHTIEFTELPTPIDGCAECLKIGCCGDSVSVRQLVMDHIDEAHKARIARALEAVATSLDESAMRPPR